jgi:hypothetical protein
MTLIEDVKLGCETMSTKINKKVSRKMTDKEPTKEIIDAWNEEIQSINPEKWDDLLTQMRDGKLSLEEWQRKALLKAYGKHLDVKQKEKKNAPIEEFGDIEGSENSEIIDFVQKSIKQKNLKLNPSDVIRQITNGKQYIVCDFCKHGWYSRNKSLQCPKCEKKNKPSAIKIGIPHVNNQSVEFIDETKKETILPPDMQSKVRDGDVQIEDGLVIEDVVIPDEMLPIRKASNMKPTVVSKDEQKERKREVERAIPTEKNKDMAYKLAKSLIVGIDSKWASITKNYNRCPILLKGKNKEMNEYGITDVDIELYEDLTSIEIDSLSTCLSSVLAKMKDDESMALVMFLTTYAIHRADWFVEDIQKMLKNKTKNLKVERETPLTKPTKKK